MMMPEHPAKRSQFWIERLKMTAHPEGGYFREVYRAKDTIPTTVLPSRFSGKPRSLATSIYFLIDENSFSGFHRLSADEVWHFYDGGALTIYILDKNGARSDLHLGRDIDRGEALQAVVPAGSWFAAAPDQADSFSLVGCAVSPGFEFTDFTLAERRDLIAKFPRHRELITRFTRA